MLTMSFLCPGVLTRIVGIYASDEIGAGMLKFQYATPGLLEGIAPTYKRTWYLRHLFKVV